MKRKRITASICASLLSLVGCTSNKVNEVNNIVYDNAEEYSIGSFKYDSMNISKVVIDWISGEVNVKQMSDNILNVTENSEPLKEEQKVHYLVKDNTLFIRYCKSGYMGVINRQYKKLYVELPKDIDLDCSITSANLTAEDLFLNSLTLSSISGMSKFNNVTTNHLKYNATSGGLNGNSIISMNEAKFESISGNINFSKMKSESFYSNTTSGNLSIGELVSDSISTNTISGKTEVKDINGKKMTISSSSGSINLGVSNLELLSGRTISGETTITIKNDLGIDAVFDLISGKVKATNDFALENKHYIYGNKKCVVEIKSTSGNVILRKE